MSHTPEEGAASGPAPTDPRPGHPPRLAPEIGDILRAALDDPRSRIFTRGAAATANAPGALLAEDVVLDPRAAATSAAERHLVAVHRSELALALREAFTLRFLQDPAAGAAFELVGPPPDASGWRERVEPCLRNGALEGDLLAGGQGNELPAARDTLERCAERGLAPGPTPRELALLALRLEDGHVARIHCAEEALLGGRPAVARWHLEHVLDSDPDPEPRWIAGKNLGYALLELGRPDLAAAAYGSAARVEGCGADVPAWALVLALGVGALGAAREAAARVRERLPVEGAPLARFLGDLRAYRVVERAGPRLRESLASLSPDAPGSDGHGPSVEAILAELRAAR